MKNALRIPGIIICGKDANPANVTKKAQREQLAISIQVSGCPLLHMDFSNKWKCLAFCFDNYFGS